VTRQSRQLDHSAFAGVLIPNDAYRGIRRVHLGLCLLIAGFLLPVTFLQAFDHGFVAWIVEPVTAVVCSIAVLIFAWEILPALEPMPHHVAATKTGLVIVRRYMFRDHFQFLPWATVTMTRARHPPRSLAPNYVVTCPPKDRPPGWVAEFSLSSEAIDRIRPGIPDRVRIA
jgi:hypothetical protein